MRSVTTLTPVALAAMLIGSAAQAQTCDYRLQSASWQPHTSDSIQIAFQPDVVGPVSSDPQNPSVYDAIVRIRFNGGLVNEQIWRLRWHQSITCPASCPTDAVCEEKEWSNNKNDVVRDRRYCGRDMQNNCVCPPLGGAPVAHKSVPRPGGSGIFEVEILPLNLQGCTPINPENDRRSFLYPGGGGVGVPGSPAHALALLAGALALTSMAVLRRRKAA